MKIHRMGRASVVTMGRLIISCVALTALGGCAGLNQREDHAAKRVPVITWPTDSPESLEFWSTKQAMNKGRWSKP